MKGFTRDSNTHKDSRSSQSTGIDELVIVLRARVRPMTRSTEGPFLFAVDHCFPIRGQGTVLTGTVLRGHVAVNQTIELPELKLQVSNNSSPTINENYFRQCTCIES